MTPQEAAILMSLAALGHSAIKTEPIELDVASLSPEHRTALKDTAERRPGIKTIISADTDLLNRFQGIMVCLLIHSLDEGVPDDLVTAESGFEARIHNLMKKLHLLGESHPVLREIYSKNVKADAEIIARKLMVDDFLDSLGG